ncbi:hypothetical protein ACJJTC_003114 [Scirpophaga incertulas]
MSFQRSIDSYFKSKSAITSLSASLMDSNKNKSPRKRNLTLKKSVTPKKISKVDSGGNISIISLCSSDEENYINQNYTCENGSNFTNSSQDTIIYSPTPQNNLFGGEGLCKNPTYVPQSPQKESLTSNESTLKIRSPRSINTFYSPNKQRWTSPRNTQSHIKRNLIQHLNETSQLNTESIDKFLGENHQDQDDKTTFLLKIIHKFLQDKSLRCLINKEYQQLLESCMQLKKPSIRLVCRLYWRKDYWYKEDKIKSIIKINEEITDVIINDTLKSLIKTGFIISCKSGDTLMSLEDYCNVLNVNELKLACKEFKLENLKSKQAAVVALKKYSNNKPISNIFTGSLATNSERVTNKLGVIAGACYKLSNLARDAIYRLYVLMYLGINYNIIRQKKLELMLINDKIDRETFPINDEGVLDSASIVFKNNTDFERYIQAHIAYEKFIDETNASTRCEIINQIFEEYRNYEEGDKLRVKSLPVWLRRFTPMNLISKILETGVQDLKKCNNYAKALDILTELLSQGLCRQQKRAEWYSEKALVLQKLKKHDEAARVLLEGFNTIGSQEEKDVMRPRAKRLLTVVGDEQLSTALQVFANKETILEKNLPCVSIYKQPMENTGSKGKLKFRTRSDNELKVESVEDVALTHYLNGGLFNKGKHCEGRILETIFFILFWDVIYTKPLECYGLFLSRFQEYPLDMFSQSFYTNRKEDIETKINKLKSMSMDDILCMMNDVWRSRPKHELSGINRDVATLGELCEVCQCLEGPGLAILCGRLARNFWYAKSGFPDLTLWNSVTKKIKFVEVKSDSDKPSMKQIQWMHYLQQNGIDTEFCYVGVNSARNKARASN